MPLEWILFSLRLLSGALLLAMAGAFMVLIWREYRASTRQAEQVKRVHGKLVALLRDGEQWLPLGTSYPLLAITSFGRAPTNTVTIDDAFASAEHATLALRGGQWWLEDRNSRNGTHLNNEPLTFPTVVTHGDIVGIGTHYFQIVLE